MKRSCFESDGVGCHFYYPRRIFSLFSKGFLRIDDLFRVLNLRSSCVMYRTFILFLFFDMYFPQVGLPPVWTKCVDASRVEALLFDGLQVKMGAL